MEKNLLFKLILTAFLAASAFADSYLIEEMESLKNTLSKNDPDRTELSLRLADLYFDVSIQEGVGSELISQREKALKLYSDVLNGRDELKSPKGEKAILINYQIGRVLNKLGRFDEAKNYFQIVFDHKDASKKLKREASFSLAEYFEEKINFKKSNEFYLAAIDLCSTIESCNYAHYKRAWLLYKEVKIDEAIKELKLSLWDSKKQPRDKIINDLLLFFSSNMTNGENELAFISELSIKTGQKDLVRKLVEGFYGAGNRIAGTTVLEKLNSDNPDAFYEMRLLEEFYGFREWDKVDYYLGAISKRTSSQLPSEIEDAKEFKAMLKRIIVQLDSEVSQDNRYSKFLKRSISQYLVFYPHDDMRKKMQQGWLKVEDQNLLKIDQLAVWIAEDIQFGVSNDEIRKLRQTRLSLAQKEKKTEIIIDESLKIAEILKGSSEADEFTYTAAHEYYKSKNYKEALHLFIPLSKITDVSNISNWAILSQNLVLDIYNTQKNFDLMVSQASSWINFENDINDKKIQKELSQMKEIAVQARFQKTVSLGETKEALSQFYKYCFDEIYIDKSCVNAKVLSIKLADQEKLVSLLEGSPYKSIRDEKALMYEYERMGQFVKAATLQEKYLINKKSEFEQYFKVSLLYEIGLDFKNRDRLLKEMMSKFKKEKNISEAIESALFVTLRDANLLDEKSITLPWSIDNKLAIARRLSSVNPSKSTDSLILSQSTYSGSRWARLVLMDVEEDYAKQKKIGFYGNRSQSKFKRRVRAIEKLTASANKYLNGANSETRIYLLSLLKKANQEFSQEILNTPIPEGLTEDVLLQVNNQLAQLSAPYIKVADDYSKLMGDEISLISDLNQKTQIINIIDSGETLYSAQIKKDIFEKSSLSDIDFSPTIELSENLKSASTSLEALNGFERFYKTNKADRIAAYFTGRINNLKEKHD